MFEEKKQERLIMKEKHVISSVKCSLLRCQFTTNQSLLNMWMYPHVCVQIYIFLYIGKTNDLNLKLK